MSGLTMAMVALVIAIGIAFFRIRLWIWSVFIVAIFALLATLNWLGPVGYTTFSILTACLIFLNIPFLRRLATKKIFKWFARQVPQMSSTEKEAIEAGDIWWEKELFQGKPDWQYCLSLPAPTLSIEEQSFLNNQVEHLCQLLNDWQIVHEDSDLSPETWDYLKKEKFFGLIIPKQYGGLEFSPFANSSIITKIGTKSLSAAVTAMVPNSLGPAELILHYGTQAQKDYYLPRLADGREVPCFGLTSPEAGSDAGAIPDYGIITKGTFEGKETLGILLNFDKRYITLAPVATVMGLAFKLFDPDKLISEKTEYGITVCLVPLDLPGIQVGNRHFPLNQAFMNGPVRGENVFVPLDWIIGGKQNMGKGWRMLMECLSAGRGISLPALSTASGVLTYRMTGAYAAIRKQFNVPIGQFEGVEESMSVIGGMTYLLQAARHFTCAALCQGIRPAVGTAISKFHMTEMSRKVLNNAMDIHGGRGIMLGPNNYLARPYQAIPVSITVEGANILTRSLIIFGQGAIRCHPYVLEEMRAAHLYYESPKVALKKFDHNLMKHIGYFISNAVKCFLYSLTRGKFIRVINHDVTAPYIKKINWLSVALAFTSDVAMLTMGQDLKRKELISARFGDVLSYLYLASAVFKYYNTHSRSNDEWPLAKWCFEHCLYSAQEAFYGIFENFPARRIGSLLKFLVFPWGKAFTQTSDRLAQTISQMMQTQNDLRNKLTSLCYLSNNIEEPMSLVEATFQKMLSLKDVFAKLNKANKEKLIDKSQVLFEQIQQAYEFGIITEKEKHDLLDYDALRKKAISVDEFSPEYALGNIQCTKPILKQVG